MVVPVQPTNPDADAGRPRFSLTVSTLSGESKEFTGLDGADSLCSLQSRITEAFNIPTHEVRICSGTSQFEKDDMGKTLDNLGIGEAGLLTCVRISAQDAFVAELMEKRVGGTHRGELCRTGNTCDSCGWNIWWTQFYHPYGCPVENYGFCENVTCKKKFQMGR